MKEIKEEIREKDGKRYIVRKCPGCGQEILYRLNPEPRRSYGVCAKCGHPLEAWVPSDEEINKI